MINEEACLMPSLKECQRFMPWFDSLFIKGQALWFGRYDTYHKADPDHITLLTYDCITGPIFKIFKEDALCFLDKENNIWVMILSKHCRISWRANTENDEINLRMLASIAEDELKGSKGDHNDLAITNRIKNRFSTWFEERKMYRGGYIIPGTRNNAEKAYLYFDNKACSEVKKTLNEVYGIKGQKRYLDIPIPKFVQFNGDVTTVIWMDGTHTIVKRAEGEYYDEEKALMYAVIKRMSGNNGCAMTRYLKRFYNHSCDISNKKKKEKKNGSNKKANTKGNSRKA